MNTGIETFELGAKKYLVTGGAGFIGKELVKRLAKLDHEVIVFDWEVESDLFKEMDNVKIFHGDIKDSSAVLAMMKEVDACFHLAAFPSVEYSQKHWLKSHETNGTGAISVFDAAYKANSENPKPVVYMSSCAVYGGTDKEHLFSENELLNPANPYAADKASCEYYAQVAAHLFNVPCLGFRLFNAYGPYANPDSPYAGVIAHFFKSVLEEKPFTIYGDGHQMRDFVYVQDVVDALLMGMEKVSLDHKVFNICTGSSISIKYLTYVQDLLLAYLIWLIC